MNTVNSVSRVASVLMVLLMIGCLPASSVTAEDAGLTLAGDAVHLNGPWFVGDVFELSVIVHNNATHDESASLLLNFSGTLQQGQQLQLAAGNSAELRVGHTLTQSGAVGFQWSVLDGDSAVSIQDDAEILVELSQSLEVEALSVAYDADTGFTLTWEVALSAGKQREVDAIISFDDAVGSTSTLSLGLVLEPGERTLTHTLGQAPAGAETVSLSLLSTGWLAVGNTTDAIAIDSTVSGLAVRITDSLDPEFPAIGEAVNLNLELSNSGPLDVGSGRVLLIDGQKRLLAEVLTDGLASGSTREVEIEIESWMSTSTTTLRAEWRIAGRIESTELEVVSANSAPAVEADSLDIPWTAVLFGVLAALGVVMSLRMATVWRSRPSEPTRRYSRRGTEPKAAPESSSDEKRDISCPACERALRVPLEYSGQVKCPSCRTQFSATGDSSEARPEEPRASAAAGIDSVSEPADEPTASSSDDVIGCPNCDQVLRVPYEKRPAKARCPSCKTIFHALAE